MFDPTFAHPDHLPGEPASRTGSAAQVALALLAKLLWLVIVAALCLPLWPFYLLLRLVYPRPPVVPSLARTLRCARLILTERTDPPLSPALRLALLLELTRRVLRSGFAGLAWLWDELLFGRALRATPVTAPLFELSAARSGSTQLAHYLEDDPHICAPNALMEGLPFLWLWRLARPLSRFVSAERVRGLSHGLMPPEHHERHEMDLLRTDTFEIVFLFTHQLGDILLSLGPRVLREEMRFGVVDPAVRALWEDDFLRFIDGVGRRTLLLSGQDPEGRPRRLLIKGHFLNVASHLERRYPDACFLTVLRAPEKRIQSIINFHRCQPTISPCPAPAWPWLVQLAMEVEPEYCDVEMAWFLRADGPRRCIVPFDAYVRDLEGTMHAVYRLCMNAELPPHVPRVHAPRVRTNYSVDRSLAQLGVDEGALKRRLEAYGRWCRRETVS